jgi:hypothetical protein
MASEVNSRRSYDAKGRRAQSAATRQRIVDSARELILERGYRATTVAQLAEAHKVWRQISDRRAANRREFVTVLQEAGGLRAGLSIDDAADTVWATSSPDLYVLLTVERGWSPLRYEAWLADSWRRLLLD